MNDLTIVNKIWTLCNILRGDGIGYHQYVSEITYLLLLKAADQQSSEEQLPLGYRWTDLISYEGNDLLGYYQEMLTHLGRSADSDTIRAIYSFPTTVFSHSENLRALIEGLATISWDQVDSDQFGNIYEGLIERSSQDVRSGAGQYFTPRPLINSIVRIMKPKLGETIQDPAVGSGGFFIASNNYVRNTNEQKCYLSNPPRYQGVEIEKNTRRICLMNVFLNHLDATILHGDTLTTDAVDLQPAHLILANPPFGAKAGARRKIRDDIQYKNANKQILFLQHICQSLRQGGRAAVIVPDNVLFETGVAATVRRDLLNRFNLHTILRLPQGIFYSAGVKTNVLCFTREQNTTHTTTKLWIYDLRTNMPRFGKTTPLRDEHFLEFESCYGNDPYGRSNRINQGPNGRFRSFTREELSQRDDNLDISWMRDENWESAEEVGQPEDVAAAIADQLRNALEEIDALINDLATPLTERE